MRICVSDDERQFKIIVPTWVMANGLSAFIIAHSINRTNKKKIKKDPASFEEYSKVRASGVGKFFREVKKWRKAHPDFKFVEVHEKSGDLIEIFL